MSKQKSQTAVAPFTVLIDTAEQLPYAFHGLRTDARQGRKPLVVPTAPCNLLWGDYSIDGHAGRVAVERKSLTDFCGTATRGRMRFVRELAALNEYDAAWVVVECELSDLMNGAPAFSQVNTKTLWRSVMAWQLEFPRVHWWGCPGREVAEAVTFRLLEKWWVNRIERPAAKSARAEAGRKAEEWIL